VLLDRVPALAERLRSPIIVVLALASAAVGAFLVRGSRRPTAEPPTDSIPVSLAAPR
jgi:hypothetical protein